MVKDPLFFSSEMVSQVRSIPPSPLHGIGFSPPTEPCPPRPLHGVSVDIDLSAAQHADVLFVKVTGIDE